MMNRWGRPDNSIINMSVTSTVAFQVLSTVYVMMADPETIVTKTEFIRAGHNYLACRRNVAYAE